MHYSLDKPRTHKDLNSMVLTGMLVGNAHPTVYQEFRRSKNARFSERSQRLAAQLRAAGIEPEV